VMPSWIDPVAGPSEGWLKACKFQTLFWTPGELISFVP
jgi:hypothetical protein